MFFVYILSFVVFISCVYIFILTSKVNASSKTIELLTENMKFQKTFNKADAIELISEKLIEYFENSMLPKAKITVGKTEITIYYINNRVIGVDNQYYSNLVGKIVIVSGNTVSLMDEYKVTVDDEPK